MKTKFMILLAALGLASVSSRGATITMEFDTALSNTVVGGDLVLTESGTGPTNVFSSDRFDDLLSAAFQVTNIPGVGILNVTATSLSSLNVTVGGLGDGSTGYNAANEFTSFVFDRDVIITALDWSAFTTDSVSLSNGATNLGTFTTGTNTGGIDFSDTNPATMSIAVSSGDAFTMTYDSGTFELQSLSLTVIPEPSSIILMSLVGLAAVVVLRKRK